jgi:predicted type IV restriction endonuclease
MQIRSNVSLSQGQQNLRALIKNVGSVQSLNEAATRIHFIDRLLVECLGWEKSPSAFRVEEHQDGDYVDYILGSPSAVVVEAKKAGILFDTPADVARRLVHPLRDICTVSKEARSAIGQVQGYCNDAGVEIGVVCNAVQLIAFVAVRVGKPWRDGRALLVRGGCRNFCV